MKTIARPNIQSNVKFTVTKKVANPNGFLLPHILFDRIQTVATQPIKEFYLNEAPQLTDYKFKMHKNAYLKDELTIQAQLVNSTEEKLLVNVIVSKSKKHSKNQERICSAQFTYQSEEDVRLTHNQAS
ncbi:hypothetical protein [Mangrovimonas aestuarii]|uniref:hypothetical protein n=1 Tax=Mangrovimonas aestuarii TaxID=3018443 RepID=UPI002378F11E|nr:hypothetical protein [Mangrovimonas aestuarii]